MSSPPEPFRPALLIVDVQEDFCPPDGALAVPGAREILPIINELLELPFVLKIATKDHHPPNHVSFASNHPNAQPFVSTTTIKNPANLAETYETRLWPDHCVTGTPGNELVPALTLTRLDAIVEKGTDPRVEMYSAFRAPLRGPPLAAATSDIETRLHAARVSHVFVVGLAGDYCVKASARDSAELGWHTYVVDEAVRSVGGAAAWAETVAELEGAGVTTVHADGQEVGWVRASGGQV
ncbi:Nicotinamidase [Trametes pubescens]|uniref:nicotinamidase n=1 Tax=Trametes pubescens TaxID=154538 RepID=A0A1M2VCS8_TRAPU|nr:Nicotinamidase [Trametes pubescens]